VIGRRATVWLVLLAAAVSVSVPIARGGPAAGAGFRTISGLGAWCWFADPRAVYHDGTTYAGWVNGQGHVVIATLHGSQVHRTDIGQPAPPGRRDDHDDPALLVEPSGRITAFFSDHNGPAMYWRRTRHPWDASSWGAVHKLANNERRQNTYPNPVRLSKESAAYLFWRGDVQPTYARRKHDRWSKARKLVSSPGDPYMKVASNDRDTIGFAFTNGHPRDAVTNIYYARYRAGTIAHADGSAITKLKDAPFAPAEADEVYDAEANGGRRAWIHDVAFTPAGRPVIVFATFSLDGYSHRYEYARWTGTSWVRHPIVDAGGRITTSTVDRFYSGGVVLDHRDPRVVYASVGQLNHHGVERLVTRDGGATWQAAQIASGSSTDNVRPFLPRGLPKGNDQLLWMRGFYDRYWKFKTSIVARP
jgi:hypothetical protein